SNCSSGVANISDPQLTRSQNGGVSKSTVECVANAGSNCGNVRKCFNDGNSPQPCSLGAQQCNGTKLIGCIDQGNGTNGTTSFDCSTAGDMCVAAGNNLGCGIGTCSGGQST